jgi:hypothetical protein
MGFEPHEESRVEAVNEFVGRMKTGLEEAHSALKKAKDDMARFYNRRRTPAPRYKPGDRVYLDAKDLKTTRPSQKLAHRFLGPYVVERTIGRNAYKLKLPRSMSRIHPVFNVIKLKPAPEDPIPGRRAAPPPEPVIVEGETEYELEKVLDSRRYRGKLQFLVSWKGYGREENMWVDEHDLHAEDLVKEFYRENPHAPRSIRTLQQDFARTLVPRRGVMSGNPLFKAYSQRAITRTNAPSTRAVTINALSMRVTITDAHRSALTILRSLGQVRPCT